MARERSARLKEIPLRLGKPFIIRSVQVYSFLKKVLSTLLVLYLVALILNLKVGGVPTRDWTQRAWNSPGVQKVYRGVRDRIMALIRKDISVEEVFQSPHPGKTNQVQQPGAKAAAPTEAAAPKGDEVRTINMEKLDEQDRQALEKILDKAAQ